MLLHPSARMYRRGNSPSLFLRHMRGEGRVRGTAEHGMAYAGAALTPALRATHRPKGSSSPPEDPPIRGEEPSPLQSWRSSPRRRIVCPSWVQCALYGWWLPFMGTVRPLWVVAALHGYSAPFMGGGCPSWVQCALYGWWLPSGVLRGRVSRLQPGLQPNGYPRPPRPPPWQTADVPRPTSRRGTPQIRSSPWGVHRSS